MLSFFINAKKVHLCRTLRIIQLYSSKSWKGWLLKCVICFPSKHILFPLKVGLACSLSCPGTLYLPHGDKSVNVRPVWVWLNGAATAENSLSELLTYSTLNCFGICFLFPLLHSLNKGMDLCGKRYEITLSFCSPLGVTSSQVLGYGSRNTPWSCHTHLLLVEAFGRHLEKKGHTTQHTDPTTDEQRWGARTFGSG